MPKQGINEWWAIKHPDGCIAPKYTARTKDRCKRNMYYDADPNGSVNIILWEKEFKKLGYRAVKVRITEIQEWGGSDER